MSNANTNNSSQVQKTTPTWVWVLLIVLLGTLGILFGVWWKRRQTTSNDDTPTPSSLNVKDQPCSLGMVSGSYQYDKQGNLVCSDTRLGKPCKLTPNDAVNSGVIIPSESGSMVCRRVGSVCITANNKQGKIHTNGTCIQTSNATLTDTQIAALEFAIQQGRGGAVIGTSTR